MTTAPAPGPTPRRTPVPARAPGSAPAPSRASGSTPAPTRTPGSVRVPAHGVVLRFDRAERVAHQSTALLMAVLAFTGLALYYEPLMSVIGRRDLVEQVHVWCGIALPLPIVVSALGYWGRGLRADAGRLDRWSQDDRTWLRVSLAERPRRVQVRARLRLGKFNAGQKLNTAFTVGSIVIMLGTGLIMRFYHPWPLAWRTGATFVHDWLTVAIVVVVLGHIRFALRDPEALRSIWRGTISREWAARHAPAWLAEEDAADGDAPATGTEPVEGAGSTSATVGPKLRPRGHHS